MHKVRTAAVGALLGVLGALWAPADAASAHGALTAPVSRAAACGTEGGESAHSAACRAAVAASGPGAAAAWDNLRVANVNGRDRSVIPDGKLCSGGLAQYAGLDLARTDWPTTQVKPGATFTFRYRTTIPHEGTFRLYVTKPGYQPGKPLRWADLESTPFLSITDPRRTGDAYSLPGRLPVGRTGHHVIYTIWQNSSTPDTYYSCSDVVFRPPTSTEKDAKATPTRPSSTPSAAVAHGRSAGDGDTPTPAVGKSHAAAAEHAGATGHAPAEEIEAVPIARKEPTGAMDGNRWPVVAGVVALLAVIGTIGLLALHYRPRPRHRRG